MSTADYKRGVEDALSALTPEETRNWVQQPKGNGYVDSLDMPYIFKDRKKKLLTKKVTKWFLVYDNGKSGSLRVAGQYTNPWNSDGTGKAKLYDSKEEAISSNPCLTVVGAYPIEIETEI